MARSPPRAVFPRTATVLGPIHSAAVTSDRCWPMMMESPICVGRPAPSLAIAATRMVTSPPISQTTTMREPSRETETSRIFAPFSQETSRCALAFSPGLKTRIFPALSRSALHTHPYLS